ncbi:MAG TPA: SulP family inorganic anion transporter [Steroidobacteraceae bacterium]
MALNLPLLRGVLPLRWRSAIRDALAGVTLASMDIPQVLGYARIAGMPLVTGLYTVILPVLAFAIFGSARHLVVSADSATAAIFAARLSGMAPSGSAAYVALVGLVAMLTALLLLLARIFKLGFLADFLSRTVLVGFLAGVGVQVGVAMLGDMLGIVVNSPHTLGQLQQLASGWSLMHPATGEISLVVVALILIFRRWLPRAPVSFVLVIASVALSYSYDWAGHGIPVIGAVPSGLPALGLPRFTGRELLTLLPIAASCFVMIIAQSAAAARFFAERYGERIDADADILGLSAANAAAALSGAFVVNGSPTQTAMADSAGARSQLANVVFAVMVVLVLLFLTAPLRYLPHCVLASIVFTIAVGLIDLRSLRDIRRESPGEYALAILTAAAVAIAGVEQGILLAIALSLLRHVNHSYRPHTSILLPAAPDGWKQVPPVPGILTAPGLILYRFSADLFYANDNQFANEVRALVEQAPLPVRWFVIEASAITDLDYSAARTLRDLAVELRQRNVTLVFARVSPYLRADMDRHGVTAVLGASNIVPTLHEALALAGDFGATVAGGGR